jgi:nitrate reductase gamma subunit
MTFLHIFTYFTLIVFFGTVLARIWKIAHAPAHLRWEIYPVPHEKGRAHYGGSRMEEPDWWTKKQSKNIIGEIRAMAEEIIFLKGVWENNKPLWFGSFPFHFALYMLIFNMFLLILGNAAILLKAGFPFYIWRDAYWLFTAVAWTGSCLGIMGAIRLMFSRLLDSGLRQYSSASHYFNIALIGSLYVTLFFWLIGDNFLFITLMGFYKGIIRGTALPQLPAIGYTHVYLTLIFMLYLPFTHMTHFFAKYFTYHKVRWEDEPMTRGGRLQAKILKQLNFPVSWSAPHIGADGHKTWLAIATEIPMKENKNGK